MALDTRSSDVPVAPDPEPDRVAGAGPSARRGRRRRPVLGPGWPLTLLFMGFPLWWALGLSNFVFILAAIPMGLILLRRRPTFVPEGFSAWMLFLVWVFAGAALLWADAPGTQQVEGTATLLTYGLRTAWYIACTIVLLYVLNLREDELPTRRVARLLSFLFVVAVFGGFAGVLWPWFEFTSPVEMLLPGAQEGWVRDLVHPSLAGSSEFLGFEVPRPSAPFTYSNSWGNNLALLLPFFLYAWMGRDNGWRRWFAVPVLLLAVVPTVYSLNRALWVGLAIAAVYAAVRLALQRKYGPILALAGFSLVLGAIVLLSPLGDLVQARIETPHSNERRTELATTVLQVTADGSPVAGYGNTRSISGTFGSIAGGDTPSCEDCAPPPLGTQGLLWRLLVTTGFLGTLFYLWFMGRQLIRFLPVPGPIALIGTTNLIVSLVLFITYDSLGSPLFIVMMSIALMNRELIAQWRRRAAAPAPLAAMGGTP